jgi:hypothetical protein
MFYDALMVPAVTKFEANPKIYVTLGEGQGTLPRQTDLGQAQVTSCACLHEVVEPAASLLG